MLVPTSPGLLQKPVSVVVDRPNRMDFIYRTAFEGVKILCCQLKYNFFYRFSSGASEDHMARAASVTAQVASP